MPKSDIHNLLQKVGVNLFGGAIAGYPDPVFDIFRLLRRAVFLARPSQTSFVSSPP
jgi:hypothetical protein